MTVGGLFALALREGLDRLDAQVLLLHALDRPTTDRAWLLAHDDDPVAPAARDRFDAARARRLAGEPVAYLTGVREFHGLSLAVDARVLVPRPETELLVDWALALLQGIDAPDVADLGTGSGAVALAVAHARPDARVVAVDASPGAVEVCRANARRLGLAVEVRQGNWLAGCTDRFDAVLSNPPYVAEGDPHLPSLRHEPRQALVAGPDGLADLRVLAAQAGPCLRPGGWLLLEHGWDQGPAVRGLLEAAGFADVATRQDLAGIDRCTGGRRLERG